MKPLRIGFFYPSSSIRIPINPDTIWYDSRGLTGSEGSFINYAIGLVKLGHSVTIFTKITKPGVSDGVIYCPYEEWASIYYKQDWDALCSWMTPEPLKIASPNCFKLFNQQVSDLSCCEFGWEDYVDILTPLSNSHANHLAQFTGFSRDKWRIAHNGVDCSGFKPSNKLNGKVIWASSHDRGLHWLLEAWPKIKSKADHANLHIFYDFNGIEVFSQMENLDPNTIQGHRFNELGQRSRYTLEAIKRMEKTHDVRTYKSVSRQKIQKEMSNSEVLGYPLNPIHYTETFGVSVLEACASGTVPVICADDCFEELWAPVSEYVPAPYHEHKDEYVEKISRVLIDLDYRNQLAERCVQYAKQFDWLILSKRMERTIITRGREGFPAVKWSNS